MMGTLSQILMKHVQWRSKLRNGSIMTQIIQETFTTGHVLTNTEMLLVALVAVVLCVNKLQPKLHPGMHDLYG